MSKHRIFWLCFFSTVAWTHPSSAAEKCPWWLVLYQPPAVDQPSAETQRERSPLSERLAAELYSQRFGQNPVFVPKLHAEVIAELVQKPIRGYSIVLYRSRAKAEWHRTDADALCAEVTYSDGTDSYVIAYRRETGPFQFSRRGPDLRPIQTFFWTAQQTGNVRWRGFNETGVFEGGTLASEQMLKLVSDLIGDRVKSGVLFPISQPDAAIDGF